jgi:iron complex transport system ATP-binding protein
MYVGRHVNDAGDMAEWKPAARPTATSLGSPLPVTSALVLEAAELRAGDGSVLVGPIDLAVERGQRWALLGPNGSGKTSLLLLAGARRQPIRGRVTVLGERLGAVDVRVLRRRIGHVSHRLADSMRHGMLAEDAVLTGARGVLVPWLTEFTDAERAEAGRLLEVVGCGRLARREVGCLSQGEWARVLLARALIARPELLLLDEPAAGLDLPAREALVSALEASDAETLVVATHHFEELPPSVTHAALLRGGQLIASGPVAEVLTPEPLSACFGIQLVVGRRNGRWSATAR